MTYKTILAVLQDKEDAGRLLDCALPLATRFSAHVIGVHAEPIPIPHVSPMGFADTGMIAASAEAGQERSDAIKALFEARASREGVSYEWQALETISGDSAVAALSVARACDLVVASQTSPEAGGVALANIEALLFESGRPVLFVPFAMPVDPRFSKVLVAWNGSQQAARAVFDALPLIVAADSVEIVCIDASDSGREDGAMAGVDIAAALARHGAKVTFASDTSGGIGTGEAIANRISDTGADLLVMGAYSQSWLKEFFFGGATRTLLQAMPAATLMSR